MNQNQKIKYVLRLKEENNDLKKHLLQLQFELQLKGEKELQSKFMQDSDLDSRYQKTKKELEDKKTELKGTLKNMGKMCDYITSRAVYPDCFKEEIKDQPKVKQAIECVTYLAR